MNTVMDIAVRTEAIWKMLTRLVVVVVLTSWLVLPLAYFAFAEYLDEAEGRVWPVVTGTKITDHRRSPGDELKSQITMSFIKIRPCDPKQLVVIRKHVDGNSDVLIGVRSLAESDLGYDGTLTRSRRLGLNQTGWWELDESYEALQTNTYTIEVIHQCHIGWDTRSEMYVGPLVPPKSRLGPMDYP